MGRFQSIDVATQSLANPYGLSTLPPELYQELWWYSGSYVSLTTAGTTSNVQRGSTSPGAGNSAAKLYTHSSIWSSATKCALEVALWSSVSTSTATAQLYDYTTSAVVSGSAVSTTATTATVLRSSQFTLTPGHVYGVQISTTSGSAYLTDASLIVFPNQQLLAQGSLSNVTLGTVGQKLAEAYIPLWVTSSGYVGTTSASVALIQKGSTSVTAPTTSATSANKLFTLNSTWSANQNFALEISAWFSASAANTLNVYLWDITANAGVTNISVAGTVTSPTLVRSSPFSLVPGHVYGVGLTTSNATTTGRLVKANLIALFN